MARFKRITRSRTSDETHQPPREAVSGKPDDLSRPDRNPPPALYVRPAAPYSTFPDIQSVVAALMETWRKWRKPRSS